MGAQSVLSRSSRLGIKRRISITVLASYLFVVILSEVAQATKFEGKRRRFALLFFCLWLAASPLAITQAHAATSASSDRLDQLNDCNWIVTYRGRTYDLAPLTREALARPIETDIRYALQRVPEANEHLNEMSSRLRDARAHSILASIFLGGLLVTRLLHSGQDKDTDRARTYNIISLASGGFFLGGVFSAWKATKDAKTELVRAVDAFNEKSPHKIQPALTARPLMESTEPGAFSDEQAAEPTEQEAFDAEKNRP